MERKRSRVEKRERKISRLGKTERRKEAKKCSGEMEKKDRHAERERESEASKRREVQR